MHGIVWSLTLWLGCGESKDSGEPLEEIDSSPVSAAAGPDIYAALGASITLTAEESTGETFEWNLGDGTVIMGTTVEHTYTTVGRKRVVLTVTGSNGSKDSDIVNVVVHHPLSTIEAQSSHTMALTEDAIWTVLPEGNSVYRMSINGSEDPMEIDVCMEPTSIAHHAGLLMVGCVEDGRLALIDTTPSNFDIQFLELGSGLRPTAVLHDSQRADTWWIVDSAEGQLGSLVWTDGNLGTVSWTDIGSDLKGLAQDSTGTLWMPEFRSTGNVAKVHQWEPTMETIRTIELNVDENGDSDNTTGGIPNLLENVYPSPDGLRVYTPYSHANILRGMLRSQQLLTHETSLRGILGYIDVDTQSETVDTRKHFDEKGRANAVAFSPYGDVLYVLHAGIAQLSVVDRFSHQILTSVSALGLHPTDLVQKDDVLYIYSWLTREIIALSILDPLRPEFLWQRSFINEEPLSETLLLGKQIFHDASDPRMTKTGYIACAHCHPAGDHDGLTWDFTDRGEGLRNTTSLLGRGNMAMGPLHWSGNFDEMQDFENDMRLHFGGSGFLTEDDWSVTQDTLGESKADLSPELDALASYTYSLLETPASPHPLASTDYDSALETFYTQGCQDCHGGEYWTDSSLDTMLRHDVGTLTEASGSRLGRTLDGLDTPTLLGLWSSAPYLHDGSAETIEDAIRAHTGYENLDENTMTHLVSLLESL